MSSELLALMPDRQRVHSDIHCGCCGASMYVVYNKSIDNMTGLQRMVVKGILRAEDWSRD